MFTLHLSQVNSARVELTSERPICIVYSKFTSICPFVMYLKTREWFIDLFNGLFVNTTVETIKQRKARTFRLLY